VSIAAVGKTAREIAAKLALWQLWEYASYRYKSDRNNLKYGWGVTFAEPMPIAPTFTIDHDGMKYNVYLDDFAEDVPSFLARIRIVQLQPGNQFELRALDFASLQRVTGHRFRATAERLLRAMGVHVHDPPKDQKPPWQPRSE